MNIRSSRLAASAFILMSAPNLSDGPTTVVLTGLIEASQPLTICADQATPVSAAPAVARQ